MRSYHVGAEGLAAHKGSCEAARGAEPTAESLASGVAWNLLSKLVALVLGAVLLSLLPRWLASAGFGHYSLVVSAVSFFALVADFGTGPSNARHVALYSVRSPRDLASVVLSGAVLNVAVSALVSLACFAFAPMLVRFLRGPDAMVATLRVGALLILATSLKEFIAATFQGLRRMDLLSLTNTVGNVARVGLSLALVITGQGVIGAVWGWTIGYGLACVVGGYLLFRELRGLPARLDRAFLAETLHYALPLGLIGLAFFAYTQADVLLVGKFLGTEQAGFYSIPVQLATWLSFPAAALGMTIAPTIATRFESGLPVGDMFLKSTRYVLLLFLPVAATIMVLARPIVLAVYGEGFLPVVAVLRIYMPFLVLFSLSSVFSQVLNFAGKATFRVWVLCSAAVVKVGVGVLFIATLGIQGAAWITLSTYAVVVGAYWVTLSRLCRVPARSFVTLLLRILLAAGAMALLRGLLSGYAQGPIALLAVAAIGAGLFLGLAFAFKVITTAELAGLLGRFRMSSR